MISALLAGAGIGTGLILVGSGLRPPAPTLDEALARLQASDHPVPRVSLWGRLRARRETEARRRSFAHAFSAFLDVVALALAAGSGIEGAVVTAANAGRGWAFDQIRAALDAARYRGETPWEGLDRLGASLGVAEVRELAATVALAGSEGARVRRSVVDKARALRLREQARAEAEAVAATVRMSLPTALLLFGFVVFVGYPPVATLLAGT